MGTLSAELSPDASYPRCAGADLDNLGLEAFHEVESPLSIKARTMLTRGWRDCKAGTMTAREKLASYLNRLRYGVRLDTDGYIPLEELDLAAEGRRDYGPSGWRTIDRLAACVPFGPDDVFVDYGCGKGRVVYLAARRPLKRVIGVELSPELAEVARGNLEAYGARLTCRNVEIVCSDAVSWPVPDDLTIAFLYSPFTGNLFRAVVDNLRRSIERRPRTLWVVHQRLAESGPEHPAVVCSEHLAAQEWLDLGGRVPNGNAVLECFRAVPLGLPTKLSSTRRLNTALGLQTTIVQEIETYQLALRPLHEHELLAGVLTQLLV